MNRSCYSNVNLKHSVGRPSGCRVGAFAIYGLASAIAAGLLLISARPASALAPEAVAPAQDSITATFISEGVRQSVSIAGHVVPVYRQGGATLASWDERPAVATGVVSSSNGSTQVINSNAALPFEGSSSERMQDCRTPRSGCGGSVVGNAGVSSAPDDRRVGVPRVMPM